MPMAVRTASKSRPALGRRPIPTNVILLSGIPAPRQFINISPRSPNAGMGQRKTHVRRGRVQFLAFVEIVISPSAGGGMGDALGPTTGRATGESASARQQQSGRADPLSVGFSTRSTRMRAAWPLRNTLQGP